MTLTPEHKDVINYLLRRGIRNADSQMVRLALEKGGDPNTLIAYAAQEGRFHHQGYDILSLALKKGASADYMLYHALKTGTLNIVRQAVENGHANVNRVRGDDPSVVYHTGLVLYGSFSTDIADYMLSKGMNIDPQDQKGYTPLLKAVEYMQQEMISYYVSRGANPLMTAHDGNFPLKSLTNVGYNFNGKKEELLRAMLAAVSTGEQPKEPAEENVENVSLRQDIEAPKPIKLKKPPPPKGFSL